MNTDNTIQCKKGDYNILINIKIYYCVKVINSRPRTPVLLYAVKRILNL